jgi:protocatechuate 3,4-dioxygenase beta subunit
MSPQILAPNRRRFLHQLAVASAAFAAPGAFASALRITPSQTEGPFYPNHLPLDTDNDLLIINNELTPAVGEVSYVGGRVLDSRGDPIRNAVVEIWQCDANGAYLHTGSDNGTKRDRMFQGFGRFVTGAKGEYVFRTIKPVPYPGRTPHIHFKVKKAGKDLLTTQLYVEGHPGNPKDGIWSGVKDPKQRKLITVPFKPLKGAKAGELTANFDVVIGVSPTM